MNPLRSLALSLVFLAAPIVATTATIVVQAPPADETIIVGSDISAEELAKLKQRHQTDGEVIAAAESKTRDIKIKAGGYKLVGVKDNVKLPVLFRETNDAVLNRISIPAGREWSGWLIRDGATEPSLVVIEPANYQRWILIGKKPGATSVLVVENGEPGKTAPRVLAQLDVTVGTGPTPPPIDPPVPPIDPPAPIENAVTKAARADVAAGKGTDADVRWYRDYCLGVANKLAGVIEWRTNTEFLDDFDSEIHARLGKLSEGRGLPTMRRLLSNEWNASALPKRSVEFTAAVRQQYADALRSIADRLKGY